MGCLSPDPMWQKLFWCQIWTWSKSSFRSSSRYVSSRSNGLCCFQSVCVCVRVCEREIERDRQRQIWMKRKTETDWLSTWSYLYRKIKHKLPRIFLFTSAWDPFTHFSICSATVYQLNAIFFLASKVFYKKQSNRVIIPGEIGNSKRKGNRNPWLPLVSLGVHTMPQEY